MTQSEHLRRAALLIYAEAEKLNEQAADLKRLAYGIELLAETGEEDKRSHLSIVQCGTVHEFHPGKPD